MAFMRTNSKKETDKETSPFDEIDKVLNYGDSANPPGTAIPPGETGGMISCGCRRAVTTR